MRQRVSSLENLGDFDGATLLFGRSRLRVRVVKLHEGFYVSLHLSFLSHLLLDNFLLLLFQLFFVLVDIDFRTHIFGLEGVILRFLERRGSCQRIKSLHVV